MNVDIASRLVALRKKYGYSQESLAEQLGISRQAISKWERAEASPDTDNLITLANLYGLSLDDLLNTGKGLPERGETSAEDNKNEPSKERGTYGYSINFNDDEVEVDGSTLDWEEELERKIDAAEQAAEERAEAYAEYKEKKAEYKEKRNIAAAYT
jgi:transcriptional regulator with XRE-family HTH domain